jgi:hypothetical protein
MQSSAEVSFKKANCQKDKKFLLKLSADKLSRVNKLVGKKEMKEIFIPF